MPALSSLSVSSLEDGLLTLMDASEVGDRIRAMKKQEDTTYYSIDYLRHNEKRLQLASERGGVVDEGCRVKMCKWFYQIVDFCKFRRELVSISMSILDRFLSTEEGRYALFDRKEYQLIAVTALYMAIKLHEPIEIETSLLADLSRGCYNKEEIAIMEKDILHVLNWKIHPPTTLIFCVHFLAFLPNYVGLQSEVAQAIMGYARYQAELATSDYRLVDHKFSHVALAAISNAVTGLNSSIINIRQKGIFLQNIEKYSGILLEDVKEAQGILNSIMMEIYADEDTLSIADEQHLILQYGRGRQDYQTNKQRKVLSPESPVSVTGGSVQKGGGIKKGAKEHNFSNIRENP